MEQNTKKYNELNIYERAMFNATFERRLEAMAKELQQMALALGTSIHVDSTFHNWGEDPYTTVSVTFIGKGDDSLTRRDIGQEGDLFGIVEEALNKAPVE